MKCVAITVVLAACGASESTLTSQSATLGDVHYEGPDGWTHSDAHEAERLVARWAPSSNSDKEVISVIRTELRADKRGADLSTIESTLVQAQHGLPGAQVGEPRELETRAGLQAVEVTADFVPSGTHATYHRVHAVVVTGSALVHVLYTARAADADLHAFRLVVDSIHREEG